MKSLMNLTKLVLDESGTICCTSTTRDWETVAGRFNTEGESFLTITLPTFARSLEECLAKGRVLSTDFPGFKRSSRSGRLPAFLGGFVRQVFDQNTGMLLSVPSVEAIGCIRQVCLLHSKLFEQAGPARTTAALKGYIECEKEVGQSEWQKNAALCDDFSRISHLLFGDIFSRLDHIVWSLDESILPTYGPGATAERLTANERWSHSGYTRRLHEVFPIWFTKIPNERHYRELDHTDLLEPGAEPPVRVITVPKTQKTPRIIAIEPAHTMYVQQALMRLFVPSIEADHLVGSLIGFTDQTPNQELASAGSSTGSLATLDLSEASDRVSVHHVRLLLNNFSHLREAVFACRSERADVPGHGVVHLSKFASMGSALTFPIEAMTFLVIILRGIEQALNIQMTRSTVRRLAGLVRVYGDDLIVPAECAISVKESLETYGFKVNSHKSFWIGRFRESCGKEYYDGSDVTVTKVRRRFPRSRSDVAGVQALVSFRNQLYWRGYWQTCRILDEDLRSLLGGHWPIVGPESPGLGRESVLEPDGERMDKRLQTPVVKAWVPETIIPVDELDGVPALHKCLTQMQIRGDSISHLDPAEGVDHLQRCGRPKSTRLKLRWCSPI